MIFEIKRQYFLFVSSRKSIAQLSCFLCPGILFLLLNTLVPLQKNRMITTGCSSVCSNFLYPIKQLPNISVSTNEALSNKNVASANRSGNMQEPKSTESKKHAANALNEVDNSDIFLTFCLLMRILSAV